MQSLHMTNTVNRLCAVNDTIFLQKRLEVNKTEGKSIFSSVSAVHADCFVN